MILSRQREGITDSGLLANDTEGNQTMKAHYSDYASHCLRYYARHPNPNHRDEVSALNWGAAERAVMLLPQDQQQIVLFIYRERDTLSNNVLQAAASFRVSQDFIWQTLHTLEKEIAKFRNLI